MGTLSVSQAGKRVYLGSHSQQQLEKLSKKRIRPPGSEGGRPRGDRLICFLRPHPTFVPLPNAIWTALVVTRWEKVVIREGGAELRREAEEEGKERESGLSAFTNSLSLPLYRRPRCRTSLLSHRTARNAQMVGEGQKVMDSLSCTFSINNCFCLWLYRKWVLYA